MADESYVTKAGLLATTALSGNMRVTQKGRMVVMSSYDIDEVQIRFTNKQILSTHGSNLGVFATTKWLLVAVAPNPVMLPSFLESGEIYEPIEIDLNTQFTEIPEVNPYRPTVPEEFNELNPILYSFQREMQENLRKQHNITQMGDTTYHWSYMIRIGPEQLWKLGSQGRFYHEEFGIITARYCKFIYVVDTLQTNAPVGFVTYGRRRKKDFIWEVTNDISRSGPNQVLGISASLERLREDYYGWVIIEGTNLTSIPYDGTPNPERGTRLIWGGNHFLADHGVGRVIAEFWKDEGTPGATIGSLHIRTDGFSDSYFESLVDSAVVDIEADLIEIQQDIAQLIDMMGGTNDDIEALQAAVAALQVALATEASTRYADDQRIRQDFIAISSHLATDAELAAVDAALRALIAQTRAALEALIATAQATADAALEAVTGGVDVEAALDLINAAITDIYVRLRNQVPVLPMTTGTIPAEFMVDDDGNLIYTEIM